MQTQNKNDLKKQYQLATKNPNEFWACVANSFQWQRPWEKVQSGDFLNLNVKWFEGAKLNITENCLDRHLKSPHTASHLALKYIPNDPALPVVEYTFEKLHREVCQAANALKKLGVQKGDVVCLYMGMVPELLIGVLACARVGAIHSVVFGGFSASSLAQRIDDCQAKVLIVSDTAQRGDKTIALKAIADEALEHSPSLLRVLVHQRGPQNQNNTTEMKNGRDYWWHQEVPLASSVCPAEVMDAEDPLFILYTSGSTGKPKGLLHTTAGYMVWAAYTFTNVFQARPFSPDLFWCTADLGWITGHSYVTYGPLLNGVTTVMFEGIPTWPTPARFWQEIDRLQVTHFYTAPTAIRALEAQGVEWFKNTNLSSLKVLGSVGEPINEEAWQWYFENVGKKRCPIVDTWWQTETGGIMISSLAGITPSVPAHATLPLPGVHPILVNEKGEELTDTTAEGHLCIRHPWPGMARTIYGDHQRFYQTYFSTYKGYYFTGDGAKRDERGYYRITGRVDDVVNVSGHRIGTAEVEDVLNKHSKVVESAVVGRPHPIKGQGLYAYIILLPELAQDTSAIHHELNQLLTKEIGPIAKLDYVQIVPDLPKTRSGKIMRRILRKVAEGDVTNLGDTSTLLNPALIETLIKGYQNS